MSAPVTKDDAAKTHAQAPVAAGENAWLLSLTGDWTWHIYAMVVLAVLCIIAILFLIYKLSTKSDVPAPVAQLPPAAAPAPVAQPAQVAQLPPAAAAPAPVAQLPPAATVPAPVASANPVVGGRSGKSRRSAKKLAKSLLKSAKKALHRK